MDPLLALALFLASGGTAPSAPAHGAPAVPAGRARMLARARPIEDAPAGVPLEVRVVAFAESPALRELAARPPVREKATASGEPRTEKETRRDETVKRTRPGWTPRADGALQDVAPPPSIPAPLGSFDGCTQADNASQGASQVVPPDTNGDVGPSHYVEQVNEVVKVFSKAGALLAGPLKASTFWGSLGGICATADHGDPIALYDQLADRWLLSQFNFTAGNVPPYHECVAISKTGDPTGAWYQYDFQLPGNEFNDYPHFGVWPDGYYMTTNQFYIGGPFDGGGAFAFDRRKMLVGDASATAIYFNNNLAAYPDGLSGLLPSDHDGLAAPPAGTPNLLGMFTSQAFGDQADGLRFFELVPDFANPAASTFTEYHTTAAAPLAVAAFDPTHSGVPQPGGTESTGLTPITDRFMHRFAYRNYGGHESWAVTHTVGAPASTVYGTFRAAPRYYELRRTAPGAALTVYEQATYAPNDGVSRFMGSAAMDGEGNLAVGYAASSTGLFPGVRYGGRLANDPLGGLMQGEGTIVNGGGSQTTTTSRWGDYSALGVDPVDDCTFWYAQEYYSASSPAGWATRIGSFKVNPGCATPPRGTLSGTVTTCTGGTPVAGAVVWISDGHSATTAANGTYSIKLPAGSYDVTATRPIALCSASTAAHVAVTNGATTMANLCAVCLPSLQAAQAPTLTAESCVPANGGPDPGEMVSMSFALENTGLSPTANLVATLLTGGGVGSPSAPVSYGAVAPGGTVSRTFSFKVGAACGETFTPTFHLVDGHADLGTVAFSAVAGAPSASSGTFGSGNVSVAIPDNGTVDVPISVAAPGIVTTVQVKVRIAHTSDSDLVISLVAPDSTVVTLANHRGGLFGADFGTGATSCAGTPTVFDDAAATPISAGAAPFAGTYAPDSPLSALVGKTLNGTWKLRVADTFALDTGTVFCAQVVLNSNSYTCCGSFPDVQPAPLFGPPSAESCGINGQVDPGETVTMSLPLKNVGTAATTNLVGTLQMSGGITGVSAPQSYGVLTAGGSSVTRPFTFTALGTCGGTATATLKLTDGAFDLGTASFDIPLGSTATQKITFSNTGAITVPAGAPGVTIGSASPYPSNILVSGFSGNITSLTVSIPSLSHAYPSDVDILLVGPQGQAMTLLSDVVGAADWTSQSFTFDDAAPQLFPFSTNTPASGTYRPTDYTPGDAFPAPAPAVFGHAPVVGNATLTSTFGGTNPNGIWHLYVVDDAAGDSGSLANGWSLTINAIVENCCVTKCPFAGDANGDGKRDVTDVFYLVNRLFAAGPAPIGCSDVNGDGKLDVTDVFYFINWLFAGGAAPV